MIITKNSFIKLTQNKFIYKISLFFIFFALTIPTINLNAASVKGTTAAHKKGKKKKPKHPKRNYNPEATRAQAIDMITSNSEKISELAGLQPKNQEILSNEQMIIDEGENIDEIEKAGNVQIDKENFTALWLSYIGDEGDDEDTQSGLAKTDVMRVIMDWLGTPYRFGGMSNRAIDCSAFVRRVYYEAADLVLPRTAREQINVGTKIKRDNLEFGDMVFFYTYSHKFASHTGIYLGDNLFAHSSSRTGVTVSSLDADFYKSRFIEGRRLTAEDINLLQHKTSSTSIQ